MKQTLFEYDKWQKVDNPSNLFQALKSLSQSRYISNTVYNKEENEADKNYQPFLRFSNNEIRANNYVGFIQTETDSIEIYPKVFRNNPTKDKKDMLKHIFYWFKYCKKWKFPISHVHLDSLSIDEFPELIINLIANQFIGAVSNQPLMMYQSVEETLQTPRGSINFKRYIKNNLVWGKYNSIACDYEPYLFDNKVNRVIKYCSRLLMNKTKHPENLNIFQEVIFILDEVEDIQRNEIALPEIGLNILFDDYIKVIDTCKLILNQQLYSSDSYEMFQLSFLIPMEYVFEDFVAGFLEKHISKDWYVKFQKADEYLATNDLRNKVFNLQHDIFLTSKQTGRKIIIDTKYKLRAITFKDDPKRNIAQSDLYQMTSYAFRRGCTDILLLYPNLTDTLNDPDVFEITSGFNSNDKIRIVALEIPFWTEKNIDTKKLENKLYSTIIRQLQRLT